MTRKLPLMALVVLGLVLQMHARTGVAETIQGIAEAAESGNPEAQFELAKTYSASKHRGDKKKALTLFIKSANQGHSGAAFHVGVMFEQGLGEKGNMKKAIKRYFDAAESGNVEAMHTLAKKYAEGSSSLGRDPKKARKWREKAVAAWREKKSQRSGLNRH